VINRGVPMRESIAQARADASECVELCDTLMMSAIKRFGNVNMPLPSLDTIFFKFQGSDPASIDASVKIVSEIARNNGEELWRARKSAHWSAMALVEGSTCYSTDVCVPVSNLPRLVHETKRDLAEHGIVGPLLG
jgi:D-lactate dehydrogenase (cytochrome)